VKFALQDRFLQIAEKPACAAADPDPVVWPTHISETYPVMTLVLTLDPIMSAGGPSLVRVRQSRVRESTRVIAS
jgi:hypothetical protein